MSKRERRFRSAVILLASLAQKSDARKKLDTYFSKIGAEQSDRRAQQVAAIQTRDQAERRQQEVRKKIIGMIGGLPEFHGPVKFKQFGEAPGDGFRVEKIAYESL